MATVRPIEDIYDDPRKLHVTNEGTYDEPKPPESICKRCPKTQCMEEEEPLPPPVDRRNKPTFGGKKRKRKTVRKSKKSKSVRKHKKTGKKHAKRHSKTMKRKGKQHHKRSKTQRKKSRK